MYRKTFWSIKSVWLNVKLCLSTFWPTLQMAYLIHFNRLVFFPSFFITTCCGVCISMVPVTSEVRCCVLVNRQADGVTVTDSTTLCITQTYVLRIQPIATSPSPPPPSLSCPLLHLAHPTCHITFPRQPREKGRGLMNWCGSLTGARRGQGHTPIQTHTNRHTNAYTHKGCTTRAKWHCVHTPSFTCHLLSSAASALSEPSASAYKIFVYPWTC